MASRTWPAVALPARKMMSIISRSRRLIDSIFFIPASLLCAGFLACARKIASGRRFGKGSGLIDSRDQVKNVSMRLITRGDMDGLTSAVIITLMEPIDEVVLVHPQDVTDKRIPIRGDDILANVPYHPDCGTWFDHHLLTDSNEKPPANFKGRYRIAPSTARLVYEYYLEKFPVDPRLLT